MYLASYTATNVDINENCKGFRKVLGYRIKWQPFRCSCAVSCVETDGLNDINSVRPSGQYMYSQFNIQQLYVLSALCIYVFMWIWEQTAIISLYSINWMVFITETESVYCAVRTVYLL